MFAELELNHLLHLFVLIALVLKFSHGANDNCGAHGFGLDGDVSLSIGLAPPESSTEARKKMFDELELKHNGQETGHVSSSALTGPTGSQAGVPWLPTSPVLEGNPRTSPALILNADFQCGLWAEWNSLWIDCGFLLRRGT